MAANGPSGQANGPGFPMLPWESGGIISLVLNSELDPYPWLRVGMAPMAAPPLPSSTTSSTACTTPSSSLSSYRPIRKKLYASVVEGQKDDARAYQLSKWTELLELALNASSTGRQVQADTVTGNAQYCLQDLVNDVLASKSSSTLATRATSIFQYLHWFRKNYSASEFPFPIKEHTAYMYLTFLKRSNAAATRGAAFLQSWNFCVGVLGFDDPDGISSSPRCVGAAHVLYLGKRMTVEKAALSMGMVCCLELITEHARDPKVQAMAGYCLFLAFGRLRASDGARTHSILDQTFIKDGRCQGVIEGKAVGTKTARSKEKQRRFLPVLVPVGGVSGVSWWTNFLQARRMLGMDGIDTVDGTTSRILCPFVNPRNPIDSGEVSIFLRYVLGASDFSPELVAGIASHSLKATFLAMAAKAGLDMSTRQLLGYHVVRGEQSALNYGRDNMAAPLEKLEGVLPEVREGSFCPDVVRGLRHPDLRVPPVQALFATVRKESFIYNIRGLVFSDIVGGNALTECVHNVSTTPPGAKGLEPSCSQGSGVVEPSDDFIDVDTSESEGAANDVPDDAVDDDTMTGEVLRAFGNISESSDISHVVRHRVRKTVHRLSVDPTRAACGESLDDRHELIPWADTLFPRCSRPNCFGRG